MKKIPFYVYTLPKKKKMVESYARENGMTLTTATNFIIDDFFMRKAANASNKGKLQSRYK